MHNVKSATWVLGRMGGSAPPYYGDMPTWKLSDLTHMEDPWVDARVGYAAGERNSEEITHAAMAESYANLSPDE